MSLATLFNIPNPDNVVSFSEFSFSNADHHDVISKAIFVQKGITVPVYILDPMPFFDLGVWFRVHQQSHNAINGILGISGVDLTAVDFRDPGQIANWIRLHGSEHTQWTQVLGVS